MSAQHSNKKCHQFSAQFSSGQAFLDILIATSIFLILSHAIFTVVIAIYDTLLFSKNRLSAKYVATQRMEYLLNLPYNDLGTTNGVPVGIVPEYEIVQRNGQNYEIHTSIIYKDDPYDDIAPNDLLPTDYKQIRVSVNLRDSYEKKHEPIVLSTNVSPQGVETSQGGGTLSFMVIDALAQPVSAAQIHITNTDVIPNIDITLQTNVDGRVILPGTPACSICYHAQVSKEGYTSDKTYTTDEVANPNQRPITVEEGHLAEAVFIIDKVSPITVTSYRNSNNFPISPNSTFRLTGTKTLGTNVDGESVYKFDQTLTTNSNGEYFIEAGEWDTYLLSIPSDQNEDLSSVVPNNPISIEPGTNYNILFSTETDSDHSLLVSITNASGSAIASASATLTLLPDFIASKSSGLQDLPNFGQVFFDNLENQIYELLITHPNYATSSGVISIDNDTTDTIILTEN